MAECGEAHEITDCSEIEEVRCTDHSNDVEQICKFSRTPDLEKIRQLQDQFCKERNWDKFHTPRNILLALVGEVGELAEIFQWKGEVEEGLHDWSEAEKEHLGQELSDVLIYLVRLADKCNVDLPAAVMNKMQLNHKKYPSHNVYGSSSKYTAYVDSNALSSDLTQTENK